MNRLAAIFFMGLFHCGGTFAQACQPPMVQCTAGSYGPGGCYLPTYKDCHDGFIFDAGLVFCPRGEYGPGGAYKPTYTECDKGAVYPAGMVWCPKGDLGPGGAYKPGYRTCNRGRID
jgi:hypothetical protein